MGTLFRKGRYFSVFSAPTAEALVLLVLSMLALESTDSIRFLYRHFLSKHTLLAYPNDNSRKSRVSTFLAEICRRSVDESIVRNTDYSL